MRLDHLLSKDFIGTKDSGPWVDVLRSVLKVQLAENFMKHSRGPIAQLVRAHA